MDYSIIATALTYIWQRTLAVRPTAHAVAMAVACMSGQCDMLFVAVTHGSVRLFGMSLAT